MTMRLPNDPMMSATYLRGYQDGQTDAKSKWTPCSEKLPENDDWVVVTILDEYGDTPFRYTDFGWYFDRAECWIVDAEQRNNIVAWMPLPKPYKGGDAE